MIQLLARYQQQIAYCLLLLFMLTIAPSSYGRTARNESRGYRDHRYYAPVPAIRYIDAPVEQGRVVTDKKIVTAPDKIMAAPDAVEKADIGGPSQPEMASFKSVGTDNMVNLFTGDFSYNIPLLDVGGYPVNIFYDGGISMEQEASWVGLGWNINPGTISRNMRGVPDDFNGEDKLTQIQNMKANKTWGLTLGADVEVYGIKSFKRFTGNIGADVGVSFNNYLGPAFNLGLKGSTSTTIGQLSSPEKSAIKLGGGLNIDINSRSGVTFSPSVSLTASSKHSDTWMSNGLSIATSYNSRSGIKALQLSEQTSFYKEEYRHRNSASLFSTTISFARPSYIPTLRMPLTNTAFSGHFQTGVGIFGTYVSVDAEVFLQKSAVADKDTLQVKPLVGYLYYQQGKNDPNAVMDFARFNDKEVTPNTTIVSAPQYSYDVFSIQGEGTGGSVRAYRTDAGYVRDNYTVSKEKSSGIGADIGPPGHYGANLNIIKTPSTIGEWKNGNKLRSTAGFQEPEGLHERVYFRNPGETSVLNEGQFDNIGGVDLVRYKLGGTNAGPTIEPILERFSKEKKLTGTVSTLSGASLPRQKRTQVVSFLTAEEAALAGLDKVLKSYHTMNIADPAFVLYDEIPRFDGSVRKKHHISQVNVTEGNGKRYVYGIPVYNTLQRDFTFSVENTESDADKVEVKVDDMEMHGNSHLLDDNSRRDGYVNITETPAYSHSFLLSGLLSNDYVDVTGDGISDDDQGDAVKFNYSKIDGLHKWRTPLSAGSQANFNAGSLTEIKDDKGIVSYGERESWYMQSIESKTMIAIFTLANREDGKGPESQNGGVNTSDNTLKKLSRIDLYSKSDYYKNGVSAAKPIKTVHFVYTNKLCAGTPDQSVVNGGKLTLESIYFTFNGQNKGNKNKYVFDYGNLNQAADNPQYEFGGSDRWGNYKPRSMNPKDKNQVALKNSEFPYSIQDKTKKTEIDQQAAAWALKKILLPSGGQIEVNYESDDYAYVQNKRATDMMQVAGFGKNEQSIGNSLYGFDGLTLIENNFVFVNVPEACSNKSQVLSKYLDGIDQLCFRYAVEMPKGTELLTSYAAILDYGRYDDTKIWIKLKPVEGMSPLSLTAVEYLREQLPGQAYPGYDVSGEPALKQMIGMLKGMFAALNGAFKSPVKYLREKSKARFVDVARSFVRLNDPDGYKYGGGQRVRSVRLNDNWKKMTGQDTSVYGQEYNYETTEILNGVERTISSGVASYEPGIGGEENPFQTIVQVADKVPLGPASYGAVEMPVLEAFFPAAGVGYSKVTVRSLRRGNIPDGKKSRSGVGKQVTEFHTAKDYPVYFNHTLLDPAADKQQHDASLLSFFYKYALDRRAVSQGFIVATNDMHGQMKAQYSYAETDLNTPISYTKNFYRNTGSTGMDDKFDFVYKGGTIQSGNMGVDVELMTDTREFTVKTSSFEVQGQVDNVAIIFPAWVPFIWGVDGQSENTYRAVTTTKVVNYHSVLENVQVMDKGSVIATKNLVYDAETGNVIVNQTSNEFRQPIYSTNYPAYWAYSGMGPACQNIDAIYEHINFKDGRIVSGIAEADLKTIFESGDELYLLRTGDTPLDVCAAKLPSGSGRLLWAFDKNKPVSSLTDITPEFVFIDATGNLYSKDNVSFRIIRSGKRNMLDGSAGSAVSMVSPISQANDRKLLLGINSKVINASAVEYRENWQTDNEVIRKYRKEYDPLTCITQELPDCNGYLEQAINPYRKGLIGNFRPYRSLVFYGERKEKADLSTATNIAQNGFLEDFKLYWDFNGSNNLVPDQSSTKWVWNSRINRVNARGLELETMDAMNVYTAAQYGFNKSMPVAIANNARYDEMANESFEDKDYQPTLNTNNLNTCAKKHIDFTGMTNSQVVNTTTASFSAHTGQRVLAVNANSTATKTFPVRADIASAENLFPFEASTGFGSLTDVGINIGAISKTPSTLTTTFTKYPSDGFSMKIETGQNTDRIECDGSGGYHRSFSYAVTTTHYIESPACGVYSITVNVKDQVNGANPGDANLAFHLYDADNNEITVTSTGYGGLYDLDRYYSCNLQKGVYRIVAVCSKAAHKDCVSPQPNVNCEVLEGIIAEQPSETKTTAGKKTGSTQKTATTLQEPPGACTESLGYNRHTTFNMKFNSITAPVYQSLYSANGCSYTKPVKAIASMLNETFRIPATRKMVFSAWVREDCGNAATGVPCNTASYLNNSVKLEYDGGSTQVDEFHPAGSIIEGWQRYEGVFTAPVAAANMTVKFVNASSSTIWFDDIRMHPFNANMKTYVYDPINLRLKAELDANNYASFYEYDEEGTLIRTKAETREGIKTITETRSSKQKNITVLQ